MTEPDAKPAPSVAAGTALVLLSAAGFGSISVLVQMATDAGAGLLAVLFSRYTLGTVLLTLLGVRELARTPKDRLLRLLLIGGTGQAVIVFIALSALRWINPAVLSFLFFTFPAWVTLIGAFRGEESLTRPRASALALSLAGVAVMVGVPGLVAGRGGASFEAALASGGGRSPWPGVFVALGGAVLYALLMRLMARLSDGIAATAGATCVAAGSTLAYGLAAAVTATPVLPTSPRVWVVVAILGTFSTVVALIAFLAGLAALGPVRTAIVGTAEPFWTTLLAALLLGQKVTLSTLAGGVLIAGAVVLLQRRPAPA